MALIALTTSEEEDVRILASTVVAVVAATRGEFARVYLSSGVTFLVKGTVAATLTALGL